MDTLIIDIYDSAYSVAVVELNHGNGIMIHNEDSLYKEIYFQAQTLDYLQFKNWIDKKYSNNYRRIIIIDNTSVDIVRGAELY